MEDLKWKKFPVLDDGFICLVDYMGDDSSVCQAARVCYGEGTRKTSDDRHLIRYLMRHQHMSPFEMCELKFLWRVPMDVWRQVVRHRTASINEYSTRYSVAIDSAYVTEPDKWRVQSKSNKQGSEGFLPERDEEGNPLGEWLTERDNSHVYHSRATYNQMLERGVAREQARKVLPLSTYTEAYWKMDLRNLLHFLSLRMEEHAQWEIRQYANIIGNEIIAKLYPMVWEAFCDYELNSLTLTQHEMVVFAAMIRNIPSHSKLYELDEDYLMLLAKGGDSNLPLPYPIPVCDEWKKDHCRERDEFVKKIKQFKLG